MFRATCKRTRIGYYCSNVWNGEMVNQDRKHTLQGNLDADNCTSDSAAPSISSKNYSTCQLSTHLQFRLQYIKFGKVSHVYQHWIDSSLACHCTTRVTFTKDQYKILVAALASASSDVIWLGMFDPHGRTCI